MANNFPQKYEENNDKILNIYLTVSNDIGYPCGVFGYPCKGFGYPCRLSDGLRIGEK
jgi:hypothetical protein